MRRVARALPSHNRSNSDRNGSGRRASVAAHIGRRAIAPAATLSHAARCEKLLDQRASFRRHDEDFVARNGALRAKDDVVAFYRRACGAHDLAKAPPQTIAVDRVGNRLGADHVANSPGRMQSRRCDQLEKATIDPATRAEERFECAGAAKAIATAAASAQSSNRSDGQPRAALGAARREHLAPADRLHAAPKSMLSCAAKLRGLKCAFHGSSVITCSKGSAPNGVGHRSQAPYRPMAAEKPYIRAR
jgi:hypothetical protein